MARFTVAGGRQPQRPVTLPLQLIPETVIPETALPETMLPETMYPHSAHPDVSGEESMTLEEHHGTLLPESLLASPLDRGWRSFLRLWGW